MRFMGVFLSPVLLLIGQGFADNCKTCRGSDCLAEEISELECTKFIPALPFETELFFNDIKENLEYGCLELEYYDADLVQQIQQCILSSDLELYCQVLENILKLKSCIVRASGMVRSIRSAIDPILFETSVKPTDPPITKKPKTDPPTTKTPKTDKPTTKTPKTDTPTTKTPKTDKPTIKTPKTDSPNDPTNSTGGPTGRTDSPTDGATDSSETTGTDSTTTPSDENSSTPGGSSGAFQHLISFISLVTIVVTLII